MKKRMFCVLVLAGVLALVFNSGAYSQTKDQPIILKAVTSFPKTHLNNDSIPLYIEAINKRSHGRLRIDWLGGPEVFASFDQIHAVKGGTIDMILFYPFGYMKSLMPEAEAKGLSELTSWEERKSGAFELWSEIFEKRANVKYLGGVFQSIISFHVFTNRKVEKIADFKGQTIRVMPLYIPFIKALGANPVTIPPTDIYTSMERGVVDGFMWPQGMTSWGLQEVTKYKIEPGVFQWECAAIVNLDRWKKIPKDLQELLISTMADYEYIATMRAIMIEEKENKVMEKAGVKTVKLPSEDAAKFTKLAYDVTWEQIIKASPEYGPKLKKAMSKDALPKGAFPW
jgi:TRAP-type C4-dicarboxylate transport system substrate-binding protein